MSGNSHHRWRKATFLILVALTASGVVRWYLSHPPADRPPVTRVAVLPFVDAGGADSWTGLADGFSADLISRLSTLRDLRPIARSSVFRLPGADSSNAEIARRLNAGSIVRGSVRMVRDTLEIRVNLKITSGDPAASLWSREFRRPASEYFKVLSEIAQTLALELIGPIGAGEKRPLVGGGTSNPEALRFYLLGRDAQNRGTAASAFTGEGHFASAIALDPAFSLAYAGLAECLSFTALRSRSPEARDTAAARARRAAQDAIRLDPSNPEAHAALALGWFRFDWSFGEAEAEYRRAIDLGPGLSTAHEAFGRMLALRGRHYEALAELATAAELDPLSSGVVSAIARVHYFKRDFERSIREYGRAIAADPSDPAAHLGMAMSCVAAIHYREAVDAVNEALRFTGETDETLAVLGYVYAKRGDRAQAIEILERFRQPAGGSDPSPFFAAQILRGLDREEDAVMFLERAYIRSDARLLELGVDPAWDGSRDDPRFRALLKKIGLPD